MNRALSRTAKSFSSWHVAVAAEAIAAGLFARCGLDVSVQYGADQPEYDLIVSKGEHMLKVSVKGSKDGSWGLTQSLLKEAQYLEAIDVWLNRHTKKTILCFVQFKDVPIGEMPRVYLASPDEVADRLRSTAKGRGDTILYEKHQWTARAHAAGTTEAVPSSWLFSQMRIDELIRKLG